MYKYLWTDYIMPFDNYFKEIEKVFTQEVPPSCDKRVRSFKFDSQNNKYVITVEVPGFAKEHVSVELHNKMLKISAERDGNKFSLNLNIPYRLDREKISAKVQDGLLTIDAPLYKVKENKDFVKVNVE